MQVLAQADPVVLEAELLDRVAAAKAGDPFAAVLVIVPTRRLADHVRRRVGERIGACLAVEILHHRALALTILDSIPRKQPLRLASPELLEALLERTLSKMRENFWTRLVADRPGALHGLLGSLTDLREAAIAPAAARESLRGSRRERAIAEVYAAFTEALDGAASLGLLDETALVRKALEHAPSFGARYRAIFHHGAYELIGVHLDLLLALDRATSVTFLLPADRDSPATKYAEGFAKRHLLHPDETLHPLEGRPGGLLGPRLPFLYREETLLPALEEKRVRFCHVQGAEAEVTVALRSALAAVAHGVPPTEIAIVARSLAPYAAALESCFEDTGLPWTTSLAGPLRRQPEIHDLLVLLRALARDFPRAETVELLRSPRIRWPDDFSPRFLADRAEAWSREAGIVGGIDEWTGDLPAWASASASRRDATDEELAEHEERARRRHETALRIARAVETLAERAGPATARSWTGHADALLGIVRKIVPGVDSEPPSPATTRFLALLDSMRALESLLGEKWLVPFDEMVAWLERAVDGADLPVGQEDAGGIRVLDAMQARGLTFRRVFLIGMHAGLFPRAGGEDAFLRDDARTRLRGATGRPLPVKAEGEDEERLLLSLLLGSCHEKLDVSWQRAGENGKAKTPSLALREVARIVLGRPDLASVRAGAVAFPSHPLAWLEALADKVGLLTPEEDTLLRALRGSGDLGPDLAPGLEMLDATESFAPGDPRYDGRIGKGLLTFQSLAVSSLERLGRCPLQFFFRDGLRVRELAEVPSDGEPALRVLGLEIHALLDRVYRTLHEEGLFEEDRKSELLARAEALLPSLWDEAVGETGVRQSRRMPILYQIERELWTGALGRFLREDLEIASTEGRRPEAFEARRRGTIDFGDGFELEVEGRFDRVFRQGKALTIGEYKTSGDLLRKGNPTEMLQGHAMQVPLYGRLAGEGAAVELLGVGPEFDAGAGVLEKHRRVVFPGFASDAQREGFDETVRVLISLVRVGHFPLIANRHCQWCPYRSACRRLHPPTKWRESVAEDAAPLRLVQKKTRTKPRLADLDEERS